MILRILDNTVARRLAGRDFVRGVKSRYSETELARNLEDLERKIEIDGLLASLQDVLDRSKPQDPKIDLKVAKLLHQSLQLNRRLAARHGLWSYFAIVALPELVRHRWDTEQTTTRDRFWRPGTRPDSNYFGRLWWMAELTQDRGSYQLTDDVFANQSLAKGLFVRKISHHRPAVSACVKVLQNKDSKIVDAALRELQKCLSVYPLVGLSEVDLEALVRSLPAVRPTKSCQS